MDPSSVPQSPSPEPTGTRPSRAERVARLESDRFDLLVVGGGITGSAVAEEAAARGFSVALIERDDFAAGASGHTSKLLHGGLRYLAQGKVGLVREALRERSRLLSELDPSWVHPVPFLLPLSGSVADRLKNRFGTWLYERLAGSHRLGPRSILDRAKVLSLVPELAVQGLRGGVLYWEAIVDDVALTLFRVGSATRAGAVVVNHMEAVGAASEVEGGFRVQARDLLTRREMTIRSRWVADATGAWMGRVPLLAQNAPRIRPSKGIHLVFRREKLPIDVAVVLPGPDERPTFVLPAGSLIIVGTTDTAFSGDPAQVQAEPADFDYLFRTLRAGFPAVSFSPADLVDVYAGVRPLLAATAATTSELSREDVEAFDPSGRIAVAGGKLTTHQAMATRAVKLLPVTGGNPRARRAPERAPKSQGIPKGPIPLSNGTELVARLVQGPRAEDWEDLRHRVAQALATEQAETLIDVVDRRLHALNRREPGFERVLEQIAENIAEVRGMSTIERDALVQSYRDHRDREYASLGAVTHG